MDPCLDAFEVALRLIEEDGIVYHRTAPLRASFMLNGPQGHVVGTLAVRRTRHFVFYADPGIRFAADKAAEVREFACLVNEGLVNSTMEILHGSGGIRFRTAVEFGDGELPPHIARLAMHGAMGCLAYFLPALQRVLHADLTPIDALQELVERTPRAPEPEPESA